MASSRSIAQPSSVLHADLHNTRGVTRRLGYHLRWLGLL
jgi:hypothetical protein